MKGNLLYYIFTIVRIFLYPLALIYGSVVWLRNWLYDTGFFGSVEFSVPVIAVGNLSTGGTGKTPHVEYLVRLLQYTYKVATMSRGYKRITQGFLLADEQTNALKIGDEPMQYYLKFPDLTISVAEDRMTGIPTLLQKKPEIELVVLDDAYQHRSVKAGMNILITDYSLPFYKDNILPFGSLREQRKSYERAHIILVSKCPNNITPNESQSMIKEIKPLPHQSIYFTTILYDQPFNIFTKEPIEINNFNILLVCCIAKPDSLIEYIKKTELDIHTLTYNDHHYFVKADLEEIKTTYENWNVPNKIILTTEKDATRLLLYGELLHSWGITIAVLPIKVGFLFEKEQEFNDKILKYVENVVLENNMEDL